MSEKRDLPSDPIHADERLPAQSDHHFEKNGLRTDGDDEDHEHEPPVLHPLMRPINALMCPADVFLQVHVLCCHGLSLDRVPNPGLPIWYVAGHFMIPKIAPEGFGGD